MKSKVLALFDPSKASWIVYLEALKPEFEVVYVWNYNSNHVSTTDSTLHHINEFNSVVEIVERTQPIAVFFMSIDTGLAIAINLLAKSKGIKTYLLQHGYFGSFDDYKTISNLGNRVTKSLPAVNNFLRQSVKWYLLRVHPYQLFRTMLFLTIKKSRHTGAKGKLGHFSGRRPDAYLLWSEAAFDRFMKNDGATLQQVRYIGNTEVHTLINPTTDTIPLVDYQLLIDSPLSENSYGLLSLTKKEHADFYRRLATYAASNGKQLVVKLHPEMFASTWLPIHENIVYVRNEYPIHSLISQANLCFSFYSTLLISVVLLKRVVVFEVFEVSLTKFLKQQGICTVLDFDTDIVESLQIIDNTTKPLDRFKTVFCGPIQNNCLEEFKVFMVNDFS